MFFSSNKLLILFSPVLLSIVFTTADFSPRCTPEFSELTKQKSIQKCQKLATLGAELGWSIDPLTHDNYRLVHIMFGAALDEEMGWLAWGVNPGSLPQMIGTRAAIGIKSPNGTLSCNSYNVTFETRIGCRLRPSQLEEVNCTAFEYNEATRFHIISATLNLSSVHYNISNLNIVWQIGYDVDGDEPKKHIATLQNVDSIETLNLISEEVSSIGHSRVYLRRVHGIMNIIGWGTLLPLGVIIARYFRKFPFRCKRWWFYFHVGCQVAGFFIGVIGWAIGLWLGHASKHYIFPTHRIFAIFIFTFTALQVLALRLRPKPDDDFRKLWDIYHHFLGYALLAVIVANIFQGIEILKPANKEWKWAFIGILIALGTVTLLLEFHTWKKFIALRNQCKEEPPTFLPRHPEEEDYMEARPF